MLAEAICQPQVSFLIIYPLTFKTGSLTVWKSLIWIHWLASEPQKSTCLYLQALGLQIYATVPGSFTGILQTELRPLSLWSKHFTNDVIFWDPYCCFPCCVSPASTVISEYTRLLKFHKLIETLLCISWPSCHGALPTSCSIPVTTDEEKAHRECLITGTQDIRKQSQEMNTLKMRTQKEHPKNENIEGTPWNQASGRTLQDNRWAECPENNMPEGHPRAW